MKLILTIALASTAQATIHRGKIVIIRFTLRHINYVPFIKYINFINKMNL